MAFVFTEWTAAPFAVQVMHVTRGIRLQVANEPVQCAQKTEKGLSGYTYNKQTGLVNKVCLQQPVAEVSRFAQTLAAVLEKALVRACRLPVHSLYLASIGTAYFTCSICFY